MRKIVRKFFPITKVEEEEKWLNEMADQGWKLIHVGVGKFEFESCEKGAYHIRLELLEKGFNHPDTINYLAFMEETGACVTARCLHWVYFARPRELGEFELYSDRASRMKYMKRLMRLMGVVGAANLYIGLYNTWLMFYFNSSVNVMGFINLFIGGVCAAGLWRMYQTYKKLREEGAVIE